MMNQQFIARIVQICSAELEIQVQTAETQQFQHSFDLNAMYNKYNNIPSK